VVYLSLAVWNMPWLFNIVCKCFWLYCDLRLWDDWENAMGWQKTSRWNDSSHRWAMRRESGELMLSCVHCGIPTWLRNRSDVLSTVTCGICVLLLLLAKVFTKFWYAFLLMDSLWFPLQLQNSTRNSQGEFRHQTVMNWWYRLPAAPQNPLELFNVLEF